MAESRQMTWRVQVLGERVDLEALSKSFTSSSLRLVADGDAYFLEAQAFEGATESDDVLRMARDRIGVLSGIARLAYGARVPLTPGHVYRFRPDGGKDVFVQLTATASARGMVGNVTVTTSDGSEISIEAPDPARVWASIADRDEVVSKALRLYGIDAKDWVGLYRLFEVIEQDAGGITGIVAAGWATEGSLRRFKHTANSPAASGDLARHGKEKAQPPRNPMDLSEARSLVETILHGWLRARNSMP